MSESIYTAFPARTRTLRLARGSSAALQTPQTIASSEDATLLGILAAPLALGETAQLGYLRKECELRAAFAALPVARARALHARLATPRPGDTLAARFGALVVERKHRLLVFLADARRREAIAAAGGRK
jgi:hypothetical protein